MSLYFFYLYIFSVLILGSFNVGPFSIRVYMTVIMLVYLLLSRNKKSIISINKRFLLGYAVFIILFAIALFLNGEYGAFDFNKLFLANFLNCFVTFFAIDHFIKDKKSLYGLLILLTLIIFVDDIITYLQYIGNPIGKFVAIALTTMSDVKSEISDDSGMDISRVFGEGLPIGIFGHVFTNANYMATFGMLIIGFISVVNGKIKKWGLLFCVLLSVYACFITQERMAFAMFILVSLYLFLFGSYPKSAKLLLLVLIGVIVFVVIPALLMSSNQPIRILTSNYKEDVRGEVWSFAFDFIKDHLLLGGPITYTKVTTVAPHNFFLNAFINSGLLGGLVAVYLYFYMTIQAMKLFFNKHLDIIKAVAGSVLVYNAISLFHNASIISGDTLIFILYPLMLKVAIMEKRGVQFNGTI